MQICRRLAGGMERRCRCRGHFPLWDGGAAAVKSRGRGADWAAVLVPRWTVQGLFRRLAVGLQAWRSLWPSCPWCSAAHPTVYLGRLRYERGGPCYRFRASRRGEQSMANLATVGILQKKSPRCCLAHWGLRRVEGSYGNQFVNGTRLNIDCPRRLYARNSFPVYQGQLPAV